MSFNENIINLSTGKKSKMSEDIFLRVKGITKSFGGVMAVKDMSFEIARGEILGVSGPNGSGKTTLVNLITGFVKPDSGEVFFKNKKITGLQPHKIAGLGVTRTFQVMRPYHSLPAYKNLVIPLYSDRVRRTSGGKSGDRNTK